LTLTIITACYNASSTIADTLKSIASQSYQNIEHIIIDGASTDDTLKIVQQFPHVSTIISEKDGGIYHAMNRGIGLCTGEVVGILNADDVYAHEDVISKVADLFKDASVDAIYGDLVFVDQQHPDKITRTWKAGPYHFKQFYNGWMPPHPTFFVRRSLYQQYGKFNTTLTSAADYELMLRFLLKHKIKLAYLPETMVRMRQGGKSTASLKNRLIANKEDHLAWKINGLKPHPFTLILKPLRKIKQFITYG
jgi:glycosyltransferase